MKAYDTLRIELEFVSGTSAPKAWKFESSSGQKNYRPFYGRFFLHWSRRRLELPRARRVRQIYARETLSGFLRECNMAWGRVNVSF